MNANDHTPRCRDRKGQLVSWLAGARVSLGGRLPMRPERLGEAARLAAVALEQQAAPAAEREAASWVERESARAEKRSAGNRLLRDNAERLGSIEDIDAFLGQVLLTISNLLGSHSATVWTTDRVARRDILRFVVEDGVAIPAAESSHPNATTPRLHLANAADIMPGFGTTSVQPYQSPITAHAGFDDRELDYFAAMGVVSMVSVPMVISGEHLGTFTIRLTDDRPLLDDDRELIQALANQAAVASHLTRLAEQARQAAVAQTREEAATLRAAELAKANAALSQSIAMLTAEGDLDAYLGGMLRILLDQLGADSGSLWCIDADGWYRLHTEVVGGVIKPLAVSDHPGAKSGVSGAKRGNASARRSHHAQAVERRPVIYQDVATAPEYGDEEETRAYLLSIGVRAQLIVPMFTGDRHLGSYSVRSPSARTWSAEQIELAQALGNQAALAIEINRLSAETHAQSAAAAREAAARQRAEKIAAANRLLQGPVGDLDSLLAKVLLSITELLGGHSATLWTLDTNAWEVRLRYVVEGGKAVPAAQSSHPRATTPKSVPAEVAALMPGYGTGQVRPRQSRIADNPAFTDDQKAYFAGLGVSSLVAVPLVLNEQHLGDIAIRLVENRPVPEEDYELVQTLAHQAALALHLSRSADEARRAALVDERNRMAREIHDTLAQGFAAISLQLQAAERAAGRLAKGVSEPLATARRLAHDNLIEARRSLEILKSGRTATLAEGLARLIDSMRRAGEARIEADLKPTPEPPGAIGHELLRIVQEAVTNAVRHADARRITLRLWPTTDGGVTLQVADDGGGFDPDEAVQGVGRGFGLTGMQERARAIGAGLTIISEAGAGTEVVVLWSGAASAKPSGS